MTPAQLYVLSGAGLRRERERRAAQAAPPEVEFAMLTRTAWAT